MDDLQIIQNKIYEIRGQRVMLDRDLAVMYGVETKVLNKAVKRNIERFPDRFMFQLTREECSRFQFGTLNEDTEKQDHSISNIDIYQGAKITRMSVSLTAPSAVVSRASRYIRWGPGWVPSGSRPVQMCGEGALRWGERRAYFDCR